MDFLLDPNFAYLLIVIGFLLTVFALLTPGTGFFEVGAFIVLALSGWRIIELDINVWALILLVLGIVPFIFAIRKKQRTLYMALTLAAFVIGSAFLFRSEKWWQPAVNPVVAVVVSISAGGFFWLMTTKILEASDVTPSHDLGGLIGAEGETRTDVHIEGSVYVHGEMWTAESEKPIKAGKRVKVKSREGFILHVEEIDE
jgi:membrane-bound serine protease (ClpP class)